MNDNNFFKVVKSEAPALSVVILKEENTNSYNIIVKKSVYHSVGPLARLEFNSLSKPLTTCTTKGLSQV